MITLETTNYYTITAWLLITAKSVNTCVCFGEKIKKSVIIVKKLLTFTIVKCIEHKYSEMQTANGKHDTELINYLNYQGTK
jgi:hypothetical protein